MDDPLSFLLALAPPVPRTRAEIREELRIAGVKEAVAAFRASLARQAERDRLAMLAASQPAAPTRSPAAQARLAAHMEADRQARLKSK